MAVTLVGARGILDTGTVICQGNEAIAIKVQGNLFRVSFETNPNAPSGMAFFAQGNEVRVVVTNADVPAGSALAEMSSSFTGTVGHTAQGKAIVLFLYVHSRGQEKTRHLAYTLSA